MVNSKGLIPLYLNSEMAKNILTVILFEVTVNKKSISVKDQLKVNIKTPLNELAYHAFGQHMQGEISLEAASEFASQFSQEIINGDVLVFLKARDALKQQNLIKNINNASDLSKLKENDYVDFSCNLKPNPEIEQVENIINAMEMQRIFNLRNIKGKKEEAQEINEILLLLKSNMEQYRKEKCQKFIADKISNTSSKAVVPIQGKCMIDNMDYMFDGRVGVVGKVVRVIKDPKDEFISLLKGTCFEHFTERHFEDIISTFLPETSADNLRRKTEKEAAPTIEVLPIMIYV